MDEVVKSGLVQGTVRWKVWSVFFAHGSRANFV